MNPTAVDVLSSMFNPNEEVCLRIFDDKKEGVFKGLKLSCECGKYKSIEEQLKKHNEQNRGVFYVVNFGGQEDSAITRINAQFVEMDNDSFEEQQRKVDAFPLPPSMIIRTRKSLHIYWFMDSTAKVERFRTIQKQLVKHFDGGVQLIHELSAPYPGYSESNTQRKVNHFLESGTSPITCKTICEKGFQCPKFAAGECPVKAPAAWCYQPMSAEVLLEVLHDIPVEGEAIKDLQAAREYVTDYLYNQDAVIADVIINAEIRNHFKLQPSYLKSLNFVYKEVSKAYQSNKKARKAKAGKALPEWYEPTDKGALKFMPGVLAEHMSEEQRVFYAAEQHFSYSGGVYVEMSEMEAQKAIQEKMLPKERKLSQIIDAEKQWRLLVQKDIRELNANPYIINVRNGLYNVLEDTLTEHTPDYYSTVQLNVTYDKKADCPLFKKFLADSMGGDMAQVTLLQEMLGYFLIPVNSAQKCFVIVGVAAAGKSVLLR